MARLSKTGNKASKAKARKASQIKGRKNAKTKSRAAPASKVGKRLLVSELEAQLQRRTIELNEALAQQAAATEVLQIINDSGGDLTPVLDVMVTKAAELCDATGGGLYLVEGDKTLNYGGTTSRTGAASSKLMGVPLASILGPNPQDRPFVHVVDLKATKAYRNRVPFIVASVESDMRSWLGVPVINDSIIVAVFALFRKEVRPFSEDQIRLLQSFAVQASTAMKNARLFNETQEALERQTATSEILRVISQSPTDVQPVFDAIVQTAVRLIRCDIAFVLRCDGATFSPAAAAGPDGPLTDLGPSHLPIDPGANFPSRAIVGKENVHLPDWSLIDLPEHERQMQALIGVNSALFLPMLREAECIGVLALAGKQANIFGESEIALAESFRDQALIAIENVRLFNETREALEQQKASADILAVISSSVADAQPVFDKILASCKHLFGGDELDVLLVDEQGHLNIAAYIGDFHDVVAATFPAPVERTPAGRAIRERRVMHWPDLLDGEDVPGVLRKMAKLIGYRSMVFAPMLWEGRGIGAIGVARSTGLFKPKELAMIQTFADQAVIAIQNARLFNETKEALERQTATADILKVIASSPSDVQPVFDAIAERSKRLVDALSTTVFRVADGMMYLTAFTSTNPEADVTLRAMFPAPLSGFSWSEAISNGDIYRVVDTEDEIESLRDLARLRGYRSMLFVPLLCGQATIGVIAVTRVEPGPFVEHHVQLLQTFADQAVIAISNVKLFQQLQESTRELSASLDDLRTAQDRLVQTEKLASLGQLTAGIAHEIKNPLNFVNNFSALSAELTDELNDVLKPVVMDGKVREDVDELTGLLKDNLEKVVQHGKRADSIVKNMLLHSREGSGERQPADINALLDESLNLAYHGARAEKSEFNITLRRDLDPDAGAIDVFPQEITRAFINLISNGFYAAIKRKAENSGVDFEPVLSAATKNLGNHVEIRIRDNGTGIPSEVKEKIFNPFFTTKPAGEGTGLGLSMSHDIIVKQHGGRIEVDTQPGQFTEFTIVLPRMSNDSRKI